MGKSTYLAKLLLFGCVYYFFIWSNPAIKDNTKNITFLVLGFLLFSPKAWFNIKYLPIFIRQKSRDKSPPDKCKFDILILLFRLRYLEIYDFYARLRFEQEKAGTGNWILKYLKETAINSIYIDNLSGNSNKKIKKKNKKVKAIFEKYFNFDKCYLYDDNREHSIDLQIEFCAIKPLQKLSLINSYGYFQDEINRLIKNYQFLEDTCVDNFIDAFDDFYVNRIGKHERRSSHQCIQNTWKQITDTLKLYCIYFETQDDMKAKCASLFEEVLILERMTSSLNDALREGNANSKRIIGNGNENLETIFFEKAEANSLWSKLYM